MIKQEITNLIKKSVKNIEKKYALDEIPEFVIERPKEEKFGDYSTNAAIILGKKIGKNPMEIGEKLVNYINESDDTDRRFRFEKIELAKPGFVNFTLSEKFLQNYLLEIQNKKKKPARSCYPFASPCSPEDATSLRVGEALWTDSVAGGSDWQKIGKGKTIVIDYSAPNIAKPMHVGHLRSTIIGHALYNIHKALGYKVISDNHIGDWGTQFGKLIYAYKNWGDKKKIDENPIYEMAKLYVKFHKEAEKNKELEKFARIETKKLQDKDKENIKIWKFLTKESLRDFNRIYKILGIKFDYVLGESFYDNSLEKIVKEALDKKIASKSQGAIIINLDKFNLSPFLIQKKDKAYLYGATDLAALKFREKKFKPNKILYVVSNEQALHFQQLFASLELLEWGSGIEIKHIKFGMVLGKNKKKFSTRKGETVALDDLIEKAIKLSRKIIEEKNPELSEKEKNKIAKIVGIGAIKYNDLSQNRMTDINFDWDKMLNFQGNSAPYLQYTHARIKSILRKERTSVSKKFDSSLLKNKLELSLLKQILFFPEEIEKAAKEYNPNIIADWLFKLSSRFNLFYNEIPILKAEKNIREARLNLIHQTAAALKTGLELLGIEAPERM